MRDIKIEKYLDKIRGEGLSKESHSFPLREKREGDSETRAGVLITDDHSILGCLPTPSLSFPNPNHLLDLPKGHRQLGEDYWDAAVRECWEETGIKWMKSAFVCCFENNLYGRSFALFVAHLDKFPPLSELECVSTFKRDDGQRMPEHSGFEIVPITEIHKRFFPELLDPIFSSLRWYFDRDRINGTSNLANFAY